MKETLKNCIFLMDCKVLSVKRVLANTVLHKDKVKSEKSHLDLSRHQAPNVYSVTHTGCWEFDNSTVFWGHVNIVCWSCCWFMCSGASWLSSGQAASPPFFGGGEMRDPAFGKWFLKYQKGSRIQSSTHQLPKAKASDILFLVGKSVRLPILGGKKLDKTVVNVVEQLSL